MDPEPIYSVPKLYTPPWRNRGIQREIHVQPDGVERRLLCDAGRSHPRHLSQLLPASCPLGVFRVFPERAGKVCLDEAGGDAIDADIVGAKLNRIVAGELEVGGLGNHPSGRRV